MAAYSILGFILVVIGSCSFLPQVYQVIRIRNAKELSLLTYTLLFFGIGLWCLYASLIGNAEAYLLNIIIFLTSIPIYFYLFKDRNKSKYFTYYIIINIIISISSIVIIITRIMNLWGPIVNSNVLDVTRPTWFIIVSWILSMGASIILGISFLPQVIKSIKNKNVKVNIWSIFIFLIIEIGWCIYWILFLLTNNPSLGEWLPGLLTGLFIIIFQLILFISWFVFKEYRKKI